MATITVKRRLRPVRLAYLVRPGDLQALRSCFLLNTMLWGGQYNFIVPAFRRTPSSFRTRRSASEIVMGYLSTIEPDLVVEVGADASPFGVPAERRLSLDQIVSRERDVPALTVLPWYQHRYDTRYRFRAREPLPLVRVVAPRELRTFAAAVFGDFDGELARGVAGAFGDLGGEPQRLTPESYLATMTRAVTPLVLGRGDIEVRGDRPTAFLVLDAKSANDLADYWNLRAFGWRVLPIPRQWTPLLGPAVRDLLVNRHSPIPNVSGFLTRASIMKARSVSGAAFQDALVEINAPDETFVISESMPRPWSAEVRRADQVERPVLIADEDDVETTPSGGRFSFATLAPKFSVPPHLLGAAWANVIELRSSDMPSMAEVFPPCAGAVRDFPLGEMHDRIRISTEGLTILDEWKGRRRTWPVPAGLQVFRSWLPRGLSIEPSSAGRLATRLLEIVGGPARTRSVAHPLTIKLFESVSRSASKCIAYEKLWAHLLQRYRGSSDVANRVLTHWLASGVVAVGVSVRCESCAQMNWYALAELAEDLVCLRCREMFPFPGSFPERATWAYRPMGPFGVEGHAQGAYAVAATIRVLSQYGFSPRTTWAPSLVLKDLQGEAELEVDFAMLWRCDTLGQRSPAAVLLGECKTFGDFGPVDIARMRELAKRFPECVLVFAKLAPLGKNEKKALARLATSGRKRWRNPVLILTDRELTSDFTLPSCWEDGTATEKQVAKEFVHRTSLRALCDASQQVHLGLGRGPGWPHHDEA